jgi:protocatechuate 3,4-dioxygenase beta subunit
MGPPSPAGESVMVGEGQRIANYVLRLSPRSVISGKVVDDAGDPVSRVQVAIFRYVYSQGQRRLVRPGMGAQTDDLGQYRIANLAPGSYYLSATRGNDPLIPGMLVARGSGFQSSGVQGSPLRIVDSLPAPVAGEAEMGYAPVWYPKAAGPEAASPVIVKAGAETASIDFTLRRSPVWSIRGQIVDPAADPKRPPTITLSPKGSPLTIPTGRSSAQARDGSFEITGVPPGSYVLTARAPVGPLGSPVSGPQTRMALQTVEVKDGPVTGVRLEITSGRLLKGSLKVEGGGMFPSGFISFSSPEGGMARTTSPANDGSLTIQNVLPAVYSMELMGSTLSPYMNYYVKSVRYGGREFPQWAIDFSGEGQLDIVLSSKAATIEGTVLDQQGKPAANAAIVIAPSDGAEPLRTGAADTRGNFYFAGLRPGEYRVFAWDAAAPEASDAPASLAPFESAGKKVTLAESAREKVQVAVIAPR